MQGFLELEKEDIQEKTELGLTALNYRVSELDAHTHGLATRDEVYDFVQAGYGEGIEPLVRDSTFIDSEIDLMLIFSNEGELIYSKAFDLNDLEAAPSPSDVVEEIREERDLMIHQNTSSSHQGVLRTEEGPIIVASHPVVTSEGEGPVKGTMVCARRLDGREIETLMGLTSISLAILELDETTEGVYRDAIEEISEEAPIAVEQLSPKLMEGYAIIEDLNHAPALLLRVETPRDIYQYGLTCVNYFMGSYLIIGVVIGLLSILVFDTLIISRLTRLSNAISREDTPYTKSKASFAEDEIFTLTNNIKDMLEALKEYQFRLKESERMATIGELSAMVGHDLRNPIQVVYGLSSILRRKVEKLKLEIPEAEIGDLEYIDDELHDQMNYMNKIVSDLQDYAKTIQLVPSEVDIEVVLEEVLSSMKVPSNIDVSVALDKGFPKLYVDSSLMRRMYTNLINNAVQAMPDGGRLTVRGHSADGYAYVEVEDTGVGISEENMEKIFRPLFTTKAKGTGLGLSVSERIVEAHGGEILVESEVGVGSKFTVRLPLGGAPEGDEQNTSIDIAKIADAIMHGSPEPERYPDIRGYVDTS